MKKLVVLGVQGMAGHVVAEHLDLTGDYQICGVARKPGKLVDRRMDVTDFSGLRRYLKKEKPDVVVNCVGLLVKDSDLNISKAILINSFLPHYLSNLGKSLGFKLIHVSTDCVFSGKTGGYLENDLPDGYDNYARTKALGEVINTSDLTIRTSIIGPELKRNGTGLLGWFLQQAEVVHGYTEAYWSGVTTLELAKVIDQMIKQNICGLYQLCPVKKISKYALLKMVASIWGKKIVIKPDSTHRVDKSLICTREDFEYARPEYETMLVELKQWTEERPENYTHYRIGG